MSYENEGRGKYVWRNRAESLKARAERAGQKISDAEAQAQLVATLHRPKLKRLYGRWPPGSFDPSLYNGAAIALADRRIDLPNCISLEPAAVHAGREYQRIANEAGRMIAEGLLQPDHLRFMCSEFLIFLNNQSYFLVQFGGRRHPYQINKEQFSVSYTERSIVIRGDIKLQLKSSPGKFSYYYKLFWSLEQARPFHARQRRAPQL